MIITERPGTGAVERVTISRDERRNALDVEHCDALRDAVRAAPGRGARAVVITGVGRTFCSGADFSGVYGDGFRTALYAMVDAIREAPVPVLAAVNGPAVGGGLQVALACDLRVAAPTATFALPTARIGLAVDSWTVRRLALLAGGGPARALLLGGDSLPAERAHTLGLADRLGSLADAEAWAEEIAGFAPLSLVYAKRALDAVLEPEIDNPDLAAAFDACWRSEDVEEAKAARAEKRPPIFHGR